MEHCLARLRFTKDYVGVIRVPQSPEESVYALIEHDSTVKALYLQNQNNEALWLAFAGEHIDPLAAWFRSVHRVPVNCASTVAAPLANGHDLPEDEIDALILRRVDTTPEIFEEFIQANYTIYLAHADEFLVLCPASDKHRGWSSKSSESILGLQLCRRISPSKARAEGSLPIEPYDPIFKQIREVTGPIGDSASQAASDLSREWKQILKEEPPDDIRAFESQVRNTITRISDLAGHTPGEDALAVIDDLAISLRRKQRAAFELLSSLRDFEWPPTTPTMTYERAATRLMLRAARRYARDVAHKLDLDEYNFLPVLGRDFDMHSGLFATEVMAHTEYSTVIIELPAEIRLRLGAMPVIAHEIARKREREVELIADLLGDASNNPDLRWLFGASRRLRFGTQEGRDRRLESVREMGKQLAADLLAVAAVGPQYVFSVARFAVGTLGDFGTAAQERNQLSLPSRISACLGFLSSHKIYPTFESPYFTDGARMVPPSVLRIVNSVTDGFRHPDNEEVAAISTTLRDGRIVDNAPPTSILAALWDGVVRRAGYVNEIAALISISAD